MQEGFAQEITRWPLRRRLLLSLILLPLGYGLWIAFGFNHSIANGGQIYEEVSAIRSALPAAATKVRVESRQAKWISGCTQVSGAHSGWTKDQISIRFADRQSRALVVGAISRSLTAKGWLRQDASPGPHRGKVAHWTLDVNSTYSAQAWAFPIDPGTWYLSGSWRPPGPVGQGCP
jgi:hypothetical protein